MDTMVFEAQMLIKLFVWCHPKLIFVMYNKPFNPTGYLKGKQGHWASEIFHYDVFECLSAYTFLFLHSINKMK